MEWLSGSGIFISLCFLNYFCQLTLVRSRKNYFSIFFFVKIFPKLSDVIYRFDKFVQSRVKWTATVKIRTPLSCPCPAGQTPDRLFLKIETECGHRTESRQTKSGQTDNGQRILTKSGHRTELSAKSGQKPDKDKTETMLSA